MYKRQLRVNLLLDGVCTGVGNLGCNSALFLIDVVRKLGLMVVAVEHRDQVIREVLGEDVYKRQYRYPEQQLPRRHR